ncbi:MAG: hypothetical protein JW702_07710 [Clostridiales bacterium]|nr:hypothetical protein [Clostridiales bacterium]
MKRNRHIWIISILIIISLSAAVYSDISAGTPADPLITLSYLEMRLSDIDSDTIIPNNSNFEVLKVDNGDIVEFGNSTEIILRAGKAKAFVSEKGGLADITAGKDVGMNEMIELNHLLICPLDDGRGLIFQSESWIMIKGTYSIDYAN